MENNIKLIFSKYLSQATSKYVKKDYTADFNNLEDQYNTKYHNDPSQPYPMMYITIKNSTYSSTSKLSDARKERTDELFIAALEYAKKNSIVVPDSKVYLWISDRHPWHVQNIDESLPICLFAIPGDSKFIMLPDPTFQCIELFAKYRGKCYNFDQMKALIIEKHVPANKKIPMVYFKGTPTTFRHSKLREQLQLIAETKAFAGRENDIFLPGKTMKFPHRGSFGGSEEEYAMYNIHPKITEISYNPIPLKILLDAREKYEPMYAWNKYKFLLDLPGHYPWSNRMKFLFLTKSLVIHVDTYTKGKDWNDNPYRTITDLVMKPNVDYINLTHTYYAEADRMVSRTTQRLIDENNILYYKIAKVYENIKPEEYKKITESAYKKITAFSQDVISFYIIELIKNMSKIVE
jgi:hypothetical protein